MFIGQIVLVRVAFAHQIVVDGARLDAIDQIDDNTTITNRRILLTFPTVNINQVKHENMKYEITWKLLMDVLFLP